MNIAPAQLKLKSDKLIKSKVNNDFVTKKNPQNNAISSNKVSPNIIIKTNFNKKYNISSSSSKISNLRPLPKRNSKNENLPKNDLNSRDALNYLSCQSKSKNKNSSQTSFIDKDNDDVVNIDDTCSMSDMDNTSSHYNKCNSNLDTSLNSSSDILDMLNKNLSQNVSIDFKSEYESAQVKIDELKMLRNSLIEKLIEKEKTIQDQEKTIESLQREMEQIKKNSKQKNFMKKKPNGESKRSDVVSPPEEHNQRKSTSTNIFERCHVIGDSHVRGLGYYMRRYFKDVDCFFKPGSGFEGLSDAQTVSMSDLNANDKIIFFCGTNDIHSRDWGHVFESIKAIVDKYKTDQLCFVLVPVRWDKPHLNNSIQKFNSKFRQILREKGILYVDPNYYLRPWHYARDGLHLNINGKRLLSLKLKTCIEKGTGFWEDNRGRNVDNCEDSVFKSCENQEIPKLPNNISHKIGSGSKTPNINNENNSFINTGMGCTTPTSKVRNIPTMITRRMARKNLNFGGEQHVIMKT